jgi:hypothetical protein
MAWCSFKKTAQGQLYFTLLYFTLLYFTFIYLFIYLCIFLFIQLTPVSLRSAAPDFCLPFHFTTEWNYVLPLLLIWSHIMQTFVLHLGPPASTCPVGDKWGRNELCKMWETRGTANICLYVRYCASSCECIPSCFGDVICNSQQLKCENWVATLSTVLEKLTVTQLVKKFPAFYGTRRFITVFTTARYWSCPEPDVTSPHLPTLFLKDPF